MFICDLLSGKSRREAVKGRPNGGSKAWEESGEEICKRSIHQGNQFL
jgi:hypothetical protein